MGVFLGIDIGAVYGKAVALSDGGQVLAQSITSSADADGNPADRLREQIERQSGWQGGFRYVVATGRGRLRVSFADRVVSDVVCQARGVARILPGSRKILDVGGRDARVIVLGRFGELEDFAIDADCVSGLRRLLELVGAAVHRDVREFGTLLPVGVRHPAIDLSSPARADHQVISLLEKGEPAEEIFAGVQHAIAEKLTRLLAGREPGSLVLTGGFARQEGVVAALGERSGEEPQVPPEPEMTAALGAAILARELSRRQCRRPLSRGPQPTSRGPRRQASDAFGSWARRAH